MTASSSSVKSKASAALLGDSKDSWECDSLKLCIRRVLWGSKNSRPEKVDTHRLSLHHTPTWRGQYTSFDITQVKFLQKSLFCDLWGTTSASIINREINHERMNTWGEFTKNQWHLTQFVHCDFLKYTLPIHIWKILLWLIKILHNRHLKKKKICFCLLSNSLMLI